MKYNFSIGPAAAHEDAQEVVEEEKETKRHLNVVFIGHVGRLFTYVPCIQFSLSVLDRYVHRKFINCCLIYLCQVCLSEHVLT
jgi:hypothetical protein